MRVQDEPKLNSLPADKLHESRQTYVRENLLTLTRVPNYSTDSGGRPGRCPSAGADKQTGTSR